MSRELEPPRINWEKFAAFLQSLREEQIRAYYAKLLEEMPWLRELERKR